MLLRARNLPNRERRGFVLLAVLVVVVIMTLAAYQYSEYMHAEYAASHSNARQGQTRAISLSGVNYVAAMLMTSDNISTNLNGNPYSNSQYFQDVLVLSDPDNPKRQGLFSIIGLVPPDDPNFQNQPYLFGVVDEAGKINLNALLQLDSSGALGLQILQQLPNMTDDIANSIIDWLDANTTQPRTGGAKDETYMNLSPPYHCKNGPLDSLDELLLVKGVTAQLLYGNDLNQNGVLDPNEDDGTGQVDRGWSAYLTVYSREPNADAQGYQRIYLNDPDITTLNTNLTNLVGAQMASFIIAYRLYGSANPAATITISANGKGIMVNNQAGGAPGSTQSQGFKPLTGNDANDVNTALQAGLQNGGGGGKLNSISSIFSLINASVSVPVGSGNTARNVTLSSPLNDAGQQTLLLPLLLDETTTIQGSDLPPRINVLTAPQTVLSALPMFSDADVQAIVSTRPVWSTIDSAPDPIFNTPAWLITEAKLAPSTVQAAERYITSRGNVYSFQSVAYFDGGGPSTRLEAVVDTNYGRPRIIHLKDLSQQGKAYPFPLNGSSSNFNNN